MTDSSSAKLERRSHGLAPGISVARDYYGSTLSVQGNTVDRSLWVKPRNASFFQDIVPGGNEADSKGNFRVSRATFAYLVNELQ